jgi:hypothetical protein
MLHLTFMGLCIVNIFQYTYIQQVATLHNLFYLKTPLHVISTHHQERKQLYLQLDRPRPTTLLPPRSNGKPEAAIAVNKLQMMGMRMSKTCWAVFNTLNAELSPICYLLTLLAHHFLHVSRKRVKSLTLRLLMSYIYGAPILDVSGSHTTTHHSR